MEQYKEKLKIQNAVTLPCILILASFSVLGFAAEAGWVTFTPVAGDGHWQSMWRGFLSGATCGILVLMLYGLIRNLRALKDEKKLKKLYVKTHDERTIRIWKEARNSGMVTFLTLGLLAVIITGYFNPTVSITILVCVMVCSSLCLWFKLYYEKKY